MARAASLTALLLAAAAAGWALAFPANSLAAVLVRGLADAAAVVTLGLTLVAFLDGSRHRADLASSARRPLSVAAAIWLIAEVLRVAVAAAAATDQSLFAVPLRTCVDFALYTVAGRSSLISMAAAVVVCAASLATKPDGPTAGPVGIALAGAAAAGVVARTVAGHLADHTAGVLAIAVHALAAAVWCGVLAALALTVTHRGQWARVLPTFSRLSLLAVATLLVGGVLGAVAMLDHVTDLYATGYGRVLTAKIVVTVALLILGWRNRTRWVPAARSHRTSAEESRNRSTLEVSVMAVAVALAAALAVTG